MDDLRCNRRTAAGWIVAALACAQSGCSLGVMAGRMLFGDPKAPSAFRAATHVDLVKEGSVVLIICTTPEALRAEWSSLNIDLLDGVTRRLKSQGIKVVNPDDVATWIDDNGGSFDDPTMLAQEFEADYIVHLDLDRFSFREENSKSLYRGRTHGNITAYRVEKVNGQPTARHAFEREFDSEYPGTYPVSADQTPEKVFQKRYMDRVCNQVSYLFYDHRLSEEME